MESIFSLEFHEIILYIIEGGTVYLIYSKTRQLLDQKESKNSM